MQYLMKCGHAANAYDKDGNPCCIFCNCYEIKNNKPDLNGRKAKCWQCGNITTSNYDLPFFEHKPNERYDEYYCGCCGWD